MFVGKGGRMVWFIVGVGVVVVVVLVVVVVVWGLLIVVVDEIVDVGGFVVVDRVVGAAVVVRGRHVASLVIVVVVGVTEQPVRVLVVGGEQVVEVVIVPCSVWYRGLQTTVTSGAVVVTQAVGVFGRQVASFVTVAVVGVTEQPVTVRVVDGEQVVLVMIVLS
jgi:hypothetical protein